MEPKMDERVKGVLAIVMGIALIAYSWHIALTVHKYYLIRSWLGPMAIFGGLAHIVFPPMNKEEYIAKHGEEPYNHWYLVSFGYKMICVFGVIAGAIHVLIISGNLRLF